MKKLNIGLVGGGVMSVDLPDNFNLAQQVVTIRSMGYLLADAVYITAEAIQWMVLAVPEQETPVFMGTKQ